MANISIQDIRKQYPQYNDLSDNELADRLYSKFYSDIPKDQFYSKIGLTNNNINQTDKINYATGITRTPIDTLRDLAAGTIGGLGKGGQFIANTLTGGYAPKVDWNQIESSIASPNQSLGGQITRGIGEYAPYGIAGGPGLLGGTIAGGAYGAATTPTNQQNLFNILSPGKVGGALESAGLNALTHGIFSGFNALKPSRLLRGNLTPEELQKNLEVTQGTTTGLGDVIGSPFLKRQYENVLPRIPLSGADTAMQETASQIQDKGQDILSDLGKNFEDVNTRQALQDALKKASQEARKEKIDNFNKLNQAADESNLIVGRDNFQNSAQAALNEIEQSPELKREFPSDLYNDLQSYASNNKGNSLKLSNIFKGKLNDKANDAYINGNMYEYGILKDLKNGLSSDVNESIENSDNKDLKDMYNKSQKDYAEKFAPFEDPDIVKFTRQGGDSDLLLSHFLRTGSNDRSNILSKLLSKLPTTTKDLPAYNYLSKANENGEFNPLTFRSLYNKLGENQKQLLFSDKNLRNKLDNYSDLVGKNTESFQTMFNPKTGQRGLDSAIQLSQAIGGYGLGGIPGAIAGLLLPGLAAKGAVSAITSPSIREALVKKMIENKPWNKNVIPAIQTGIQGINNR